MQKNRERRSLGRRLWFVLTDYASLVPRPGSRLHGKPGYDRFCYMYIADTQKHKRNTGLVHVGTGMNIQSFESIVGNRYERFRFLEKL